MSDSNKTKPTGQLRDVLLIMLDVACPCRFPCFVYLVGFNFQDYKTGPACCGDTEELVHGSYYGPTAFLDKISQRRVNDSTHSDYKCKICGAAWEFVFTDYSISMYRTYLRLHSQVLSNVGADVVLPFPVAAGFMGFKQNDIETCAKNFKQSSVDECIAYLTQKK